MKPPGGRQAAPGLIEMRDLLARVAEELDAATTSAREVEALASRATGGQREDPAVISGLQRLDLMTQTLADLARLLAVLAPEAGPGAHSVAPLARHLRLRDLRTRIFEAGSMPAARQPSPAGDGDIF